MFKKIQKHINGEKRKLKQKELNELFGIKSVTKKILDNAPFLFQERVQEENREKYINSENEKNNLPPTAQEAIYTMLKNGVVRLTDNEVIIFNTGVIKNKKNFGGLSNGLDDFIETPKGNILFIENKSSNAEKPVQQTSKAVEGVHLLPSKIHENNSNIWTIAVLTGNGYDNILNKLEKNEKHECRIYSRSGNNKWYPGINHYELFDGNKNNWTYAIDSEINFDKMLNELMGVCKLKVQNMYENSDEILKYIKQTFKNSKIYNNKGEEIQEEELDNFQNNNILKEYAILCISLATLKKYKPEAAVLLNKLNFKLDNTQPRNFKLDNTQPRNFKLDNNRKIEQLKRDAQAWNLQTRKYNSQKKAEKEISSSIETKYFNY